VVQHALQHVGTAVVRLLILLALLLLLLVRRLLLLLLLLQVPREPRMFQLLPWEHTKTGDTLKRIDPKVTVRDKLAAAATAAAAADLASCCCN
jgi:hypothetical protein